MLHAVQRKADDETAFPWRKRPINTDLSILYEISNTTTLDTEAYQLGETGRKLLNAGEKDLAVYVNYAGGDEGEEAWYGRGERLYKLKALKRMYDPKGILSGYNPISV